MNNSEQRFFENEETWECDFLVSDDACCDVPGEYEVEWPNGQRSAVCKTHVLNVERSAVVTVATHPRLAVSNG